MEIWELSQSNQKREELFLVIVFYGCARHVARIACDGQQISYRWLLCGFTQLISRIEPEYSLDFDYATLRQRDKVCELINSIINVMACSDKNSGLRRAGRFLSRIILWNFQKLFWLGFCIFSYRKLFLDNHRASFHVWCQSIQR